MGHMTNMLGTTPARGMPVQRHKELPPTPARAAPTAVHDRPRANDALQAMPTVLALTKEAVQAISNVPYVGAIANCVERLITIREELQTQKDRCQELLDRVLGKIGKVFRHLLKLKEYNGEEQFDELALELGNYNNFLKQVIEVITEIQNRRLWRRLLDRGTEELEKLDRMINNFDSDIISAMVIHLVTERRSTLKTGPYSTYKHAERTLTPGIAELLPPGPINVLERDEQQEEIAEALLRSPKAKVAILGMGGIGKTTLACAVMRRPRIEEAYPRRLFISFEGLSTSELVYNSLANTFSIPPDSRKSEGQILAQIVRYLGEKQTLLCIDNFETFWEVPENRPAADDFLGKLSTLPKLAIIVTLRGSQEPGNLPWLRIGPLMPLTQDGSEDLVRQIIRGQLDPSESQSLWNLLDAVAGIPLAVTLIGNLLRDQTESPRSLWHRWTQESTEAIGLGVQDRQYRLDVSLKLSVFGPRMTDNARAVLAAIAVLPAGLSSDESWLDSFQELLPSHVHLRDSIRALRNVSLCSLDNNVTPPRFQLLSPVRQFCVKHLPVNIEVVRTLIDLYNNRLYDFPSVENKSEYTWVTRELANITAILNFAFSLPYITDALAHASASYTDWMDFLGSPTTDMVQRAIDAQLEDSDAKGRCLVALAQMHGHRGRDEEAVALLEEALAIHRKLGSEDDEAWDLYWLGKQYRRVSQVDKSVEALNAASTLYRTIKNSDSFGEANCLEELADIYVSQGKYADAETSVVRALHIFSTTHPNRLGEANSLSTLGRVYREQGRPEKAIETWKAGFVAYRDINHNWGQGIIMRNLGELYRDQCDWKEAAESFKEAIKFHEQANYLDDVVELREDLQMVLDKLPLEYRTEMK